MNILQLSSFDNKGGAARAATRLHLAHLNTDISSTMLVQIKDSDSPRIISHKGFWPETSYWFRVHLDSLPLKFYPKRKPILFSLGWVPDPNLQMIRAAAPDIVHLHWINSGFIKVETLTKINQPLVWTLHDMWAFTGGCHYNEECEGFKSRCGYCPQLGSKGAWDLSRWNWKRKQRTYTNLNLTIVTPSTWLADQAKNSPLLKDRRIEVIPNGLDLERFKPVERNTAREILFLPKNKRLILFGAEYAEISRKGGDLLQEAISHFSQLINPEDYHIVLFGKDIKELSYDLPVHHIGVLRDEQTLNLLYSAVDVFVAPSRQDNLPNTILESLACGTPCAAFYIGGIPEMIDHQKTGYLAQPFHTEELAQGLKWILEDQDRHKMLCDNARKKAVKEFNQNLQAQRYQALYHELIT